MGEGRRVMTLVERLVAVLLRFAVEWLLVGGARWVLRPHRGSSW